jgi:hypothetical protein
MMDQSLIFMNKRMKMVKQDSVVKNGIELVEKLATFNFAFTHI